MAKLINLIDKNLDNCTVEYRIHATKRMFRRDIHENDVETVLLNGEIIERYDDDTPFPSILINGLTSERRPLHIVAGINVIENIIVIITTYEPDESRWTSGFSERIK